MIPAMSDAGINRRNFLRTGALALAAVQMPLARAFQGRTTAVPVRLGMASYTFRQFSRVQVIGFMKELRLHTINCKDAKDHLPSTSVAEEQQAIDAYRAAGIAVTGVGTIYFPKDEDDDIREKFEYTKRAGAKVIVAGDPDPAVLPRIERFVKQYDIRLAIHNHGPEDKIYHSPLDVLRVVKGMDPRIGCCLDVGHAMRAGTDVVKAIHELGPRLFDVHMKDLAKPNERDSQVEVGRGIMPVREIFQALIEIKYPGYVDLEYEIKERDPMPGVVESFAYMRKVLAGMGVPA